MENHQSDYRSVEFVGKISASTLQTTHHNNSMVTKPLMKAIAIFGLGFAMAWWTKPAPRDKEDPLNPLRPPADGFGDLKQTAPRRLPARTDDFRKRWEQGDRDQRKDLLAALMPGEFPILLKQFRDNASIYELTNDEKELLEALICAWYKRTPDLALAWLRPLACVEDRVNLLGAIVNDIMPENLPSALALLRQEAMDKYGRVEIPDSVIQGAAEQGAEALVACCRLGLADKGAISGRRLFYPDGFDYKLAMEGLLAARASVGGEVDYRDLPTNLMTEWTRSDPRAAWQCLQNNQPLTFNGTEEFFAAYASTPGASAEEIGHLLALDFRMAANSEAGYENAWAALGARPSSDLLENFLQSVSGDRESHLDALFDDVWGGDREAERFQVCGLLLERMTHERRMETLRRNNPYLPSKEMGLVFGPVLRRLGLSEEEIGSVFPSWPGPTR